MKLHCAEVLFCGQGDMSGGRAVVKRDDECQHAGRKRSLGCKRRTSGGSTVSEGGDRQGETGRHGRPPRPPRQASRFKRLHTVGDLGFSLCARPLLSISIWCVPLVGPTTARGQRNSRLCSSHLPLELRPGGEGKGGAAAWCRGRSRAEESGRFQWSLRPGLSVLRPKRSDLAGTSC